MRRAVTLTKQRKKIKSGMAEYWVMRWYDSAGKCRSKSLGRTTYLSKREAKKIAKQKEHEFETHPGLRTASKMTLKTYTDKYFKMQKHDISTATIRSYKTSVRYLIEYFGEDRTIDNITDMDGQHFKAALASNDLKAAMKNQRDLNRVSVNLHMRQIKAVFNFAVTKLKILPFNPFVGTVETVKQSTRWHYVNQDEFQKVLAVATENYRLMIALGRLAGLRRLEAYYLEWQDVNFENSKVHVVGKDHWQPKDRETRIIPMCPELQELLLVAFQKAPEGSVRVCPPACIENIDRDIKATIKRAGVKPWKKPLHTLRKSCITDWAGRYPMHAVKEWAGHADISTTQQYYLQVTEEQYDRAATDSFWNKVVVAENVAENENSDESKEVEAEKKPCNS